MILIGSYGLTPIRNSRTMNEQPNNPLHGVKLADIVEHLVNKYGWDELAARINVNCFKVNPSIKSTLKFLRKTQWAREKVERLYLHSIGKRQPRKNVAPRDAGVNGKPAANRTEKLGEPTTSDANSDKPSPWEAAKKIRESRDRRTGGD